MMLIPILLLALVAYAAVKFSQDSYSRNNSKFDKNDALEILNQRYSKGEISDDEYLQKKKILKY